LQVHDENVAEAAHDIAEEARSLMEYHMTAHCNKYLKVPQAAEVHIGPNWYAAKG
jgi:DNA polymerase I-like protein with 3'-5' exonuclease and polymerase domains